MTGKETQMRFVVALLGFCLAGTSNAQLVGADGKLIDAFQVEEPPVLDGRLDDDAWAFRRFGPRKWSGQRWRR